MTFPKHFATGTSPAQVQADEGNKRKLDTSNSTRRKEAAAPNDPSTPTSSVGKSVTFAPSIDIRSVKRLKEESRQPSATLDDDRRANNDGTDTRQGTLPRQQNPASPSPFRTKPSSAPTSTNVSVIPNRSSSTSSFDRSELASAFALASLSRGSSGSFSIGSGSGSFSGSFGSGSKPRSPPYRRSATGDVTLHIDQRYHISPYGPYGIVTPDQEKRKQLQHDASATGTPVRTVPSLDAHMQQRRHGHAYGLPPGPHQMMNTPPPPPPHPRYFAIPTRGGMPPPPPHLHYSAGMGPPPPGPAGSQYHYPPSMPPLQHQYGRPPLPPISPVTPPRRQMMSGSDHKGQSIDDNGSKKWACDYCDGTSFVTFEDACAHEAVCSHRAASAKGKRSSLLQNPRPKKQHVRKVSFALSRDDCPNSRATEDRTSSEEVRDLSPTSLSRDVSAESVAAPPAATGSSRAGTGEEEAHGAAPKELVCAIPVRPTPLCVSSTDATWLSDLNVYIRQNCVEAFTATELDVARTSKRGRIALHQVGIRCRFCVAQPWEEGKNSAAASVSFPVSIGGVYESVKRWHRVHTDLCTGIPNDTKEKLRQLSESSVWVPTSRQYWSESARGLGMVDSPNGGIYFTKNPTDALAEYNAKKDVANEDGQGRDGAPAAPATANADDGIANKELVLCSDKTEVSPYVFLLMSQVQPTTFTEADRFVARSKGPIGFAGFECRHCSGHAGLGKYFPSSAKNMCTNSTSQNIHSHLLKCRRVPQVVKAELDELKRGGRSTDANLTNGWRRRFFDKVWMRLHGY